MNLLRIYLFGTVRVTHDNWNTEVKVTPKAQGLLAYLLLKGQRCHTRERLAALFWGDYLPQRARSCLSTTLWRLRQALEPEDVSSGTYLITTNSDEIGFNWESNHWLDVLAFRQEARQMLTHPASEMDVDDAHLLEQTLRLYTGDVLENLYDDWVIREQERVRSLYLDCLEHLMCYYKAQGQDDQAIQCGRKILIHEPAHEAIHRALMRIYLSRGQRTLAMQQYDICRKTLARELDALPMEETELLFKHAADATSIAQKSLSNQLDLHQALKQLGSAARDFDEAQAQLKQVKQRFDEAQRQLNQVMQLISRTIDR